MIKFDSYDIDLPYSAEVVSEDFQASVSYVYPGAIEGAWVEGLSVFVTDKLRRSWVGHFAAGEESPNGMDYCVPHPDGERLVVVSRGNGYVVSPEDPARWEEINFHPIMGGGFDPVTRTLVFYDFTRAFGVKAEGGYWKTFSLSWDGLKNVELSVGKLVGMGWDAPNDQWVPFEVDLQDGSCSGGAAPHR